MAEIKRKKISPSKKTAKPAKPRTTKKVLFIEIDDEITNIFEKIQKCKHKNIYLVIPHRAVIFQSAINLKILKRKADDLEKNIYIITNDQNGINLASRLNIECYNKLEGEEHPSLVASKSTSGEDISPLKASINSVDEEAPSRRNEKKFSISDLIKRGNRGFTILPRNMNLVKAADKNKSPKEKGNGPSFVLTAPNKKALFSLLIISAVIFLVISYIALPGATLVLTPKANSLKVSTNVVLADYERNRAELDTRPPKTIPSYRVSTEIERVFNYQATGKEFEGTDATGLIIIKNTSSNDWPLVPRTRFQTSDGLVYRLDRQVLVPAGSEENPGILQVEVKADPIDAFDQPIGARGNLTEETQFFLPGLSAENQKKLFAVSAGEFTGGETLVQNFISEQDIEAARAKMGDELRAAAVPELEVMLEKKNKEQGTNLDILDESELIYTSEPDITIPQSIEGQRLDSFEVQGRIVASGVAYDKEELLSILNTELKLKKNPEKTLSYIDEDSVTFDVVNFDDSVGKVTITPTIQGIEEFEISPKKENGQRLIKKIKEHIVGKDVDEARTFIQQLPEIEKVEIISWPAWSPTLPSVPDNISIEIRRKS